MRIIVNIVVLLNLHFGLLAQNAPTLDIVPNPFVDTTSFVFTIPTSDTVSIVVYNRWGQLIDSVINEQFIPEGSHSVTFIGDTLLKDIYYVALIFDTNVVSKILVKLDQLVGFKDDNLEEQRMSIYPNPTTGLITMAGLPAEPARITVYNVLGEKVHAETLMGSKQQIQTDISNLPGGMYYLKARDTARLMPIVKLPN